MIAMAYSIRVLIALGLLVFLSVGCSDDEGPSSPGSGSCTIVLEPGPASPDAPWIIQGPEGFYRSGVGGEDLSGLQAGEYSISWGAIAGWLSPIGEHWTLEAGETRELTVSYSTLVSHDQVFATVVSGTFGMGRNPATEIGFDDELPLHSVELSSSFMMATTETTNRLYIAYAQWAAANGHCAIDEDAVTGMIDGSSDLLLELSDSDSEIFAKSGVLYVLAGRDLHPVKEVSWYGAAAFCDWMNLFEGSERFYNHSDWSCENPISFSGYRLPTEAEWEFSCRAGGSTQFSHGRCLTAGEDASISGGSYLDCPGGSSASWTTSAGSYSSNAWGIFDMHGNVFEFCNDWYGADYYSSSPSVDPTGPDSGVYRVSRGGGWASRMGHCRSAFRYSVNPGSCQNYYGFRAAKTVE